MAALSGGPGTLGRIIMGSLVIALIIIVYLLAFDNSGVVVWASTQMSRPEERGFIEAKLLGMVWRDTGVMIDFRVLDYDEMYSLLARRGRADLISDLHVNLEEYYEQGLIVGAPSPRDREFYQVLDDLSMMAGERMYVPWLTATYVFVVDVRAFEYLPEGLTPDDVIHGSSKWTYEALLEWSKRIYEETGRPMLGLPAGPEGLLYRFIHGYLLPSYTGYQVLGLDTTEAEDAFRVLQGLWNYTNPQSLEWNSMEWPLMRGEVWIAWDHIARLEDALEAGQGRLVPVPPPLGPAGRGYLVVIVGLAIPTSSRNPEGAARVIEYLTRPDVQAETSLGTGFLPAVEGAARLAGQAWLASLEDTVSSMYDDPYQVACMIPVVPGYEQEFRQVYQGLFEDIVLGGGDPGPLLSEAKDRLLEIFEEAGARLPPPDG